MLFSSNRCFREANRELTCSGYHLRKFSNQLSSSARFAMPRQMRITKMTEIQMRKRIACLIMPIMRNMANIAAIIRNGGELMNSGIANSMSCVAMYCGAANMFSPCGFRTYANCVKKQDISPKGALFLLFNPLNPLIRGTFERKCVSSNAYKRCWWKMFLTLPYYNQ